MYKRQILGFGKVGKEAARRLFEDGVRVVAVSDTSGGVRSARGLNIQAVVAHVESGHKIAEYQENGVEHITNEELIATECTILAPCAVSDVINAQNAASVQAQIVIEGGNAQITAEADEVLNKKECLVIPDLVATLGGIIVSYFERVQNEMCIRDRGQAALHLLDDVVRAAEMAGTADTDRYVQCTCLLCEMSRIGAAIMVSGSGGIVKQLTIIDG